MIRRALLAASLATLIGGCAATPSATPPPTFQAPWAAHSRPEFRDLVMAYAASNLPSQRTEVLDWYLRSQTKTFDRYMAAKEVGVGVEALQQEAITEIQSLAPELKTKQFLVRTEFPVYAYDQQLQGFPLHQEPFDLRAGVRYTNDDVRTGISDGRRTRGMAVISGDYGFTNAQVQYSKVGWFIPATPDQAANMLQRLSEVGGRRSVAVAMTYTLDRCDVDENQRAHLICTATIQSMYGYGSLSSVQPDVPPTIQLVNRNRR